MSYMEIYNEEINDLLAPEHRKLQIHENLEVYSLCDASIMVFQHLNDYRFSLCSFSEEYMLLGCEKKLLSLLSKSLV